MEGSTVKTGVSLNFLKKQLSLISKEIKTVSNVVESVKDDGSGALLGFSNYQTLANRLDFLHNFTKPGREPSKALILLIVKVIEALEQGPKSEKSIKDYVSTECLKYGCKPTNRGSVAGANIEVGAVCSILSSLHILQKGDEESSNPSPSPSALLSTHLLSQWGFLFSHTQSGASKTHCVESSNAQQPSSSTPKKDEGLGVKDETGVRGEDADLLSLLLQEEGKEDGKEEQEDRKEAVDGDESNKDEEHLDNQEESDDNDEEDEGEDGDGEEDHQKDLVANVGDDSTMDMDYQHNVSLPEDLVALSASPGPNSLHENPVAMEVEEAKGGELTFPTAHTGDTIPNAVAETHDPTHTTAVRAATGTPAATTSSRKGSSHTRIWKLAEGVDSGIMGVIKGGRGVLNAWGEVCYDEATLREEEEKSLRLLGGMCGITFPTAPFYRGRGYVQSSELDTQQANAAYAYDANGSIGSAHAGSSSMGVCMGKEYRGEELLEKIRVSKRMIAQLQVPPGQCSSNLPLPNPSSAPSVLMQWGVGVFDPTHISRLSSVMHKTSQDYWKNAPSNVSGAHGAAGAGGADVLRKKGTKHPPTLAELLSQPSYTHAHTPSSSSSANTANAATNPAGVGLTALTTSSNPPVYIAGLPNPLTTAYIKRYSRPLRLHYEDAQGMGGVGKGGRCLPDLVLTSLPVPWGKLAKEFRVLPPDDAHNTHTHASSSNLIDLTHTNSSHNIHSTYSEGHTHNSHASHQSFESLADQPPMKKSRTSEDLGSSAADSGDALTRKKSVCVDVLAPDFRELPPTFYALSEDNNTSEMEEEDMSDEAYLARHTRDLANMREKWMRISLLKQELTRSSSSHQFGQGGSGNSRGGSNLRHYRTYGADKQLGGAMGGEGMGYHAGEGAEDHDGVGVDGGHVAGSSNVVGVGGGSASSKKKRGRPPKIFRAHPLTSMMSTTDSAGAVLAETAHPNHYPPAPPAPATLPPPS
eukprot:gene27189-32852_t